MYRNLAIRGLWWKESQQLLPLIGLLIVMGTAMQLLTLLVPRGDQLSWRHAAVLLGMPGLFAAGAGALLVGHEKETRTLDWLRSLPLQPQALIRTKLLVALAGLAIIWGVSFAFGRASGAWEEISRQQDGVLQWPLHSLFLLLVGFATAWRLQSSMLALLLVIPLACLPGLLASLHQMLLNWPENGRWIWYRESSQWTLLLYQGLLTAGFGWYGWHAGLRYLKPPRASVVDRSVKSQAPGLGYRPALNFRPAALAPALLWQFTAQNRGALLGLAAILVVALLLPLPWMVMGVFLAISWLGTSVFLGDALHRRALFLADRGAAPHTVWWTRQAVPFTLVLFTLAAMQWLEIPTDAANARYLTMDGAGLQLLATALLLVYLSSQWLGQIIASPIVAVIAAPLLALLVVGYCTFCFIELDASWWSIASVLVVPIVATWLGTRDWMDRRVARRFWIRHAGLAVLLGLLPISSFLIFSLTTPRLSRDDKRQLQVIASENASFYRSNLPELNSQQITTGPESVQERGLAVQNALRSQLQAAPGAVRGNSTHEICISAALRLRLSEQGAIDAAAVESSREEYRQWISLLLDIHQRLRASWRVLEQDQADVIEMWLLEELKAPSSAERLSGGLADRVATVFRKSAERNSARRRAIALSWQHASGQQFGGYDLAVDNPRHVSAKAVWAMQWRAGLISQLLLESLEAEGSALAELRRRISQLMGRAHLANRPVYIDGPQGEPQLLYFETKWNSVPGAFWNSGWEHEAARMVDSHSE